MFGRIVRSGLALSFAVSLSLPVAGCSSADDSVETGDDQEVVAGTFQTRATGYYPDSSALEGGFRDRMGKPLQTLQSFLNGDAPYVSVAMDSNAFPYGTRFRIRELEKKYGRVIQFRVVDTGGAFRGKGRSRMDICVANRKASLDSTINGMLTVDAWTGSQPPPVADTGNKPTSGDACRNDGDCNPGNEGSGRFCSQKVCVPGCRSGQDWMCPGSKSCVSNQCK